KEVSWCPSYGPEMRGGTANCTVIVSDEPIGSPVVTQNASAAIVMNEPSFRKFVDVVESGGTLIINSNLISLKPERDDIQVIYVPATEIADELGNKKLMNMVLLGALLAVKQ
ncbi:MAG: 2-oxoacid:acceptor oxidoreductase family protein, partial [Eubacterium sp.]